jgi:hypothetical protein
MLVVQELGGVGVERDVVVVGDVADNAYVHVVILAYHINSVSHSITVSHFHRPHAFASATRNRHGMLK